jgi:hypothetical protein
MLLLLSMSWLCLSWSFPTLLLLFLPNVLVLCRPDHPGGAVATAVVVEGNGAVLPSAVAAAGFVNGYAEVTVSGLIPGTPYSLRSRCQLEDADVDPDSLWSPRIKVVTLDLAGLEVGTPLPGHRCCCCGIL